MCAQVSNLQQIYIGSDNGLAPNRWQAIIWTDDSLIHGCIYVSFNIKELNKSVLCQWTSSYLIQACMSFDNNDAFNVSTFMLWVTKP